MTNHCRRCGRTGSANRPGRWFVCPRPPAPAAPDALDGGALGYLREQMLDVVRDPSRAHVDAIIIRARRIVRRRRLRDAIVLTALTLAAALVGLAVGAAL